MDTHFKTGCWASERADRSIDGREALSSPRQAMRQSREGGGEDTGDTRKNDKIDRHSVVAMRHERSIHRHIITFIKKPRLCVCGRRDLSFFLSVCLSVSYVSAHWEKYRV